MSSTDEPVSVSDMFRDGDRAVGGIKVTNHYCTRVFRYSKSLWNYVTKLERRATLEYVLSNGSRKRVFLRFNKQGQWILQEGVKLAPATFELVPRIVSNEHFQKAAIKLIKDNQMTAVDHARIYLVIHRHQIDMGI